MFNTIKSNLKSSEDKIINFFIKKIKNYETTNTNIKQSNLKERKRERKKKRKKERKEKKNGREEEETSISDENIFDDLKENAKLQSNVDTEVQINAIYKSIKQNYIFYISILCAIYAFTKCKHNKSSMILGTYSIIFITFYGYFIHFISHYMKFRISEIYSNYDNIFTRNKYFNWFALKLIAFGEFHAKVHHDSDINKSTKNIILEFLNNFMTQGAAIIVIKYFLDLIDNRVIILWSLFYATVHNINYIIMPPLIHQQHHINDRTNFGIDIWDIIIGTKFDWENIETHNHTAINVIVIAAIIYYVSNKFKL